MMKKHYSIIGTTISGEKKNIYYDPLPNDRELARMTKLEILQPNPVNTALLHEVLGRTRATDVVIRATKGCHFSLWYILQDLRQMKTVSEIYFADLTRKQKYSLIMEQNTPLVSPTLELLTIEGDIETLWNLWESIILHSNIQPISPLIGLEYERSLSMRTTIAECHIIVTSLDKDLLLLSKMLQYGVVTSLRIVDVKDRTSLVLLKEMLSRCDKRLREFSYLCSNPSLKFGCLKEIIYLLPDLRVFNVEKASEFTFSPEGQIELSRIELIIEARRKEVEIWTPNNHHLFNYRDRNWVRSLFFSRQVNPLLSLLPSEIMFLILSFVMKWRV